MKNVIEILEKYYQSLVIQPRDWDFFLGLADYVKYVSETPELSKLIELIIEQKRANEERVKVQEDKAIEEIKQAQGKIFEIIRRNKINLPALDREMKEYEDTASGKIISSRAGVENLHWCIKDILVSLFSHGYQELFKDFAIKFKDDPKLIERYTFAPAMDIYEKEKRSLENRRDRELWGAWDSLVLAYLIIFKAEEELDGMANSPEKMWLYWNFSGLVHEMQKIKEDKRPPGFKPIYFIREKFIGYASRIHNYLLKELSKEALPGVVSDNAPAKFFDGKLYFRGKEMNFNGKPNQKDLLVTLFKEPKKNWDYDEVQEDWDRLKRLNLIKYPKNYWKKFYSAGDDINQAVAVETQIKDFIVKNTKQIRIKPEYV